MRQDAKPLGHFLICSLLALLRTDAQAQTHDSSQEMVMSRSLVYLSFYNSGTQGGWNIGTGTTGEPAMFMYPGYTALPSTNASTNYTRKNGNSLGFGIWILSREGSKYNASWSGPRFKSDDIKEFVYDPATGPEARLGVTTNWERERSSTWTSKSNYWSGAASRQTGPPVKIWNFSSGKYIPDDSFSEELVISKWSNGQGITVTRKAYAWSYQDFDDFIIEEVYLKNTGTTLREDVHVALLNTWSVSQMGHHMQGSNWQPWPDRARDDWFKYTDAGNYVKGSPGGPMLIDPADAKGLKLSYQFDGKSPFSGYDDTGEPWNTALQNSALVGLALVDGQMVSYQFVGMAPVAYADNAGIHSFNIRDRGKYVQPRGSQPAYVNRWAIRSNNDYDEPTPAAHSPAQIFDILTKTPIVDNPTDVGGWTNAQVYGPYTLAPGEEAKLVVVFVAGAGAEYAGPGGEPIDPWQWSLKATKTDLVLGERAIVEHTKHALFAYQSGYDLPDAPPDVDFIIQSDENARAKIYWSAAGDRAVHSDYGEADIAGYRIYRGLRGTLSGIGPFTLMVDIPVGGPYPSGAMFDPNAIWPDAVGGVQNIVADRRPSRPGMYSWSDPQSNAGFTYWYSLRAYAKGHSTWTNNDKTKTFADLPPRVQNHLKRGLEGGYSSELQKNAGSPVLPKVAAADRLERDIVVVPNPYFADGTHAYSGDIKIRFLNVPERAHIYIFNFAGQLIQVLRKRDPLTSEMSWNGRNYMNVVATVGSGIYFYAVKSETPGSEGKVKTGTFVVIK